MSEYTNVSWITVDDHDDTEGDGYVTHTTSPFTGRVQRSGYTTITTASDPAESANIVFMQMPKKEYVSFDEVSYSVNATGGTVTITGKTNSPRLGFTKVRGAQNDDSHNYQESDPPNLQPGMATLPQYFSITVGSQTIGNQAVSGQIFANDPGATAEFSFSITVTVDGNMGLSQRYCVIQATGTSGVTAAVSIIQAAGASYINVGENHSSEAVLTFNADGYRNTIDVDVYSNDNWTIDVTED